MNNPLPTAQAEQYCKSLQDKLDTFGYLDYEYDAMTSTEYLFGPARGQMFGVLVCQDEKGEEVILKAFSGQYDGKWIVSGYVPPVCEVSQFNAIVAQYDSKIHELTENILISNEKEAIVLQEERKTLSQSCLKELYGLYRFCCADSTIVTIEDVFGAKLPPTGTGDCCAPKLLHYAFSHRLHPVSMAEFYYGTPNRSLTKMHKQFYAPCEDKCKPLLKHLLGLDIVYCDDTLLVVNKQAGMLSVPGRGESMQDCVESRVKNLFLQCIKQPAVHRLDMDTSGLLVLCFEAKAHRSLSIQFMDGRIEKNYVALLEGLITEQKGIIELPFRLDTENRPHQIYDENQGKWGVTEWEKLGVEYFQKNRLATRILFSPKTGRTHQLRVHSAHEKGLGHPIIGDRLYGKQETGQRMLLHACKITFTHPVTLMQLCFESEPEF